MSGVRADPDKVKAVIRRKVSGVRRFLAMVSMRSRRKKSSAERKRFSLSFDGLPSHTPGQQAQSCKTADGQTNKNYCSCCTIFPQSWVAWHLKTGEGTQQQTETVEKLQQATQSSWPARTGTGRSCLGHWHKGKRDSESKGRFTKILHCWDSRAYSHTSRLTRHNSAQLSTTKSHSQPQRLKDATQLGGKTLRDT